MKEGDKPWYEDLEDKVIAQQTTREKVSGIMQILTDKEAQRLGKRVIEGRTYRSIAEDENVTISAVSGSVQRSRAKLRQIRKNRQ